MPQFTAGEFEVMQLLWEHGAMKPAEIQAVFPCEIKNAALRSVLAILVEKDHVTRRQVGKAFVYSAKTRRQRAFRTMIADLADQFCEGSTRTLLFNLVKSEKLSDDDIAELKRLAKDTSTSQKRKKKS
ncbi:Penicillinase repressor [Rubripirellula tenax]|uniref:Penicillinase repressor n=1 Tax=Rubripirellula tenax TaxID=2528015 RepID=A0A5C6FH58_9BACT|nr:BlaI/MecI/CopY family transcriptional regulator [Rubripirellula tenax]TWU59494.1 Penicillinase repressor [Rubripirellula tenax]